jgi:hypothetical protein
MKCQICGEYEATHANKRADTGERIDTCGSHRFDPQAVRLVLSSEPSAEPRVPVRLSDPTAKRTPLSKFKLRTKAIQRSKVPEVVPG